MADTIQRLLVIDHLKGTLKNCSFTKVLTTTGNTDVYVLTPLWLTASQKEITSLKEFLSLDATYEDIEEWGAKIVLVIRLYDDASFYKIVPNHLDPKEAWIR